MIIKGETVDPGLDVWGDLFGQDTTASEAWGLGPSAGKGRVVTRARPMVALPAVGQ